jgi:ribosomal protein S18 acetylase RimI-like enzyme
MLQLRRAQANDRDYAKRVLQAAYRDMVIRQFGTWNQEVQDGFFDKSWNVDVYEIICVNDDPCGLCCIHEHADCLQLVQFAIEQSMQGRGYGYEFLTMFKELAAAKSKCAQLNVMKTNTQAKALYERSGFSVYGENPVHFMMRAS